MRMTLATVLVALVAGFMTTGALAADDSKVNSATRQVESGAKEVGRGLKETAKGIGNTVVEGAKFAGEKIEESGQAAEKPARSAWRKVADGATDFGRGVKNFFGTLFSN